MTRLRVALIALLMWAAYWAALPWIDCARALYPFSGGLQECLFGSPFAPTNLWGFWPNTLVGVVYLLVAVLVAARRRPM